MKLEARLGEENYRIDVERRKKYYRILLGDREYSIQARKVEPSTYSLLIDNNAYELSVENDGGLLIVEVSGEAFRVEIFDARYSGERRAGAELEGKQVIKSIMPGKVIKLLASVGDEVREGQGLIIMEAMKMENEITSPKRGRVVDIKVKEGNAVESDAELIVIN